MGRPEITTDLPDTLEHGIHIGLPLKITGIVFWGLVAIGLVLAAETMHWLHGDMEAHQSTTVRQAELMLRVLLERSAAGESSYRSLARRKSPSWRCRLRGPP